MSRLLNNAVSWTRGSWLFIEPFAGEVMPSDSEDLFFTIATSLISEPGQYGRDIILRSNDPGNPVVRVPIDITVTEWQEAELALNPGEVFMVSDGEHDTSAV